MIAYRGVTDLFPHVGAISTDVFFVQRAGYCCAGVTKLFERHREHKEIISKTFM